MKKRLLGLFLAAIMVVSLLPVISPAFAEDDPAVTASFSEFSEAASSIQWDIDVNGFQTGDGSAFDGVTVKIAADQTLMQFPENYQDGIGSISAEYLKSGGKTIIQIPSKANKISGKPYFEINPTDHVLSIILGNLAGNEAYLIHLDTNIVSDTYFNTYDKVKFVTEASFEGTQAGMPYTASSQAEAELGRTPPYTPGIYTVTVTNDGHGTASADPVSGMAETPVTLTASPSDGYEFDHWEVVSGSVTVTNDRFIIGAADAEIKACFKEIIPSASYQIIKGNGQTVMVDSKSALFTSNAPFEKFSHVMLDGEKLAKKYYKAESGSTSITLNEDCIRKLSPGKHTLTIVSEDGSASTAFLVNEPLPKTGDSANLALLAMLMLGSVGTILLLSTRTKKRKA